MITTTKPERLLRNWGEECIIVETATHAGKILARKAGTCGGFQLHIKEENHFVITGSLILRTMAGGTVTEQIVGPGEGWRVPPGTVHQEETLTDCTIVEVSDPTREDRYAIVPDPGGLPSMTDADAILKLKRLALAFLQRSLECYELAIIIGQKGLKGLAGQ